LYARDTVRPIDFLYCLEERTGEKREQLQGTLSDIYTLLSLPEPETNVFDGLSRTLRHYTWDQIGNELHSIAATHGIQVDVAALNREIYLDRYAAIRLLERGMTLGAHGMSHRVLATLPAVEQEQEIESSLRKVSDLSGSRAVPFAFPFGGVASYCELSSSICRAAGASCACTSVTGTNGKHADPFALKRRDASNGRQS
jgi:hypothetical protein